MLASRPSFIAVWTCRGCNLPRCTGHVEKFCRLVHRERHLVKGPGKAWSKDQAFPAHRLTIGLVYDPPECRMHSGDFCCTLLKKPPPMERQK